MAAKIGNSKRSQLLSDIIVNGTLVLICLIWTIPTIGLLVSSFRTRDDIQSSGWWQICPIVSGELPTNIHPMMAKIARES